jgi:hypothetical protein
MKISRRINSLFLCLTALVIFGQNCQGQCFVNVTKECGDEQFDNPCSGACQVEGADCGLWVDGVSALSYTSVDAAAAGVDGLDDFELVPVPRYCGVAKLCKCEKGVGDVLFCDRNETDHLNYFVGEAFRVGIVCTGEPGGPGGPGGPITQSVED